MTTGFANSKLCPYNGLKPAAQKAPERFYQLHFPG